MMKRIMRRGISAAIVAALSLAAGGQVFATAHPKGSAETPAGHVAALIRQLGDEQYSLRQQAQEELARLGADAFDALVAAEQNDDIEIASRAAYLVHLIRIDWVHDSDSPQVKELLRDYENLPEDGRRECMQRLTEIGSDTGLGPLCRLIRFERSPLLSKQGAILILKQPEPDASAWPARARIIGETLQGSVRPAAKWLLAYVQFHTDPEGRWPNGIDL